MEVSKPPRRNHGCLSSDQMPKRSYKFRVLGKIEEAPAASLTFLPKEIDAILAR